MELFIALAIGVLFAAGVYLILRPNLIRIVMGFGLLSNAVNLMMIASGGYARTNEAPFVPKVEVAHVATDATGAAHGEQAHGAVIANTTNTTDATGHDDAHAATATIADASATNASNHAGENVGGSGGKSGGAMMDPLPPDIILTAIVISFAVGALFLIVCYRAYLDFGTDNPELMPQFEDPDAAAAEVDPDFVACDIPDVLHELSQPHPNAPREPDVSSQNDHDPHIASGAVAH